MSSFRNIIARRRPGGDTSNGEEAAPVETVNRTRLLSTPLMPDPPAALRPPAHLRGPTRPVCGEELPRWEIEPPKRTIGEESFFSTEDVAEDELTPEEALHNVLHLASDPSDDALEEELAAVLAPTSPHPSEAQEPADPAPEAPVSVGKIWDMEPAEPAPLTSKATPETPPPSEPVADAPPPLAEVDSDLPDAAMLMTNAAAAAAPRGGRVKTRLLGFHTDDAEPDLFDKERRSAQAGPVLCPVGFLVITDGPGYGQSFPLAPGLSTLGRGADQTVTLDFGDDSISRDNHASVAYDELENTVLIGHGGKSNIVRRNGKPLVSSEELQNGDEIRIGKTTLRFVALCGDGFAWSARGGKDNPDE